MHILRDIIYGITVKGADLRKICDDLHIDPQQLNDSDTLVPYEPAAAVWDVAIKHTGDELIGLHLGEELTPTILGMLGYLMQSSKNLMEAFVMLSKYNELYSTMMKFLTQEQGNEVFILYEPALQWQKEYPESARQSVEIGMAGTLKIFRMLCGKNIFPVTVELAYPARHKPEYERILRAPVNFNAKRNKLTFRKEELLQPVISHDKSLFAFFNTTLEQKLQQIRELGKLSDRVRQLIIRDFKGRVPPADIMASHLNLTVRSLQRRLKEEGTTYRDVAQSIKKELALAMVKKSKRRVSEIAEILGYSDLSSFSKAFKKWNE